MNEPENDPRWKDVDALFEAALSVEAANLAAFLDARCPDPGVRRRVERLLDAVHTRGSFLRTGGGAVHAGTPTPEAGEGMRDGGEAVEGAAIRGYRLIEPIGSGGMGEVWKAEQTQPVRRLVALKLLKRGMDSRDVVARFESERQALAIMSHPNIARVFDGGVSESGRPFFVMELVRGIPITEYCDQNRSSIPERLSLFLDVCAGVQHAHHKGIIHRDIKPTNVLVTTEDGPPAPKIIDFGVARATDRRLTADALHTRLGEIIGTPGYMAPEQFEMDAMDIDTRADVYALGVLLYELLTGLRPFDEEKLRQGGYETLRRIIREHEPARPSTRIQQLEDEASEVAHKRRTETMRLVGELRGDLDWIVMKTIEKDRTARYDSPHELAADIERHRRDEPVSAGPPSARYRFEKFTRRNRTAFAIGAAIVFGIVGAGVALTYALAESNRQRARTETALKETEEARDESEAVASFLSDMLSSASPSRLGRDVTVREILDGGAATIDTRFDEASLVGARLRSTMGHVYDALGYYDEARRLLEHALRIAESRLEPHDVDLTLYLGRLASLYDHLGETAKARALYERSLRIEEEVHGKDSLPVAIALVRLSSMLSNHGHHAESVPLLERSLAIQEARYGSSHPHVAGLLNNVGVQLEKAGDFAGARAYCERALEALRTSLPPDHPTVLTVRFNVADLFRSEGQLDSARVRHEAVLADRERALGTDHPDVAQSLVGLSEVYRLQGKLGRALDAADRALSIRERKLGAGHRDVAIAYRQRAAVHEARGERGAARSDIEHAASLEARFREPVESP